jgi:hypothetical protein
LCTAFALYLPNVLSRGLVSFTNLYFIFYINIYKRLSACNRLCTQSF